MDLSLYHSLRHYVRINVVRSDPESDIHKESYDIAKTAVFFLRSILSSLASLLLNRERQGKQKLPL